jgi:hypothetical protein
MLFPRIAVVTGERANPQLPRRRGGERQSGSGGVRRAADLMIRGPPKATA